MIPPNPLTSRGGLARHRCSPPRHPPPWENGIFEKSNAGLGNRGRARGVVSKQILGADAMVRLGQGSVSSLLVVGGCRSGKTRLAMEWVKSAPVPLVYIATCPTCFEGKKDVEMLARIARHQAERGPEWLTLEAPQYVVEALHQAADQGAGAAVLDCVTVWLSNLMMANLNDDEIFVEVRKLAEFLGKPSLPVALVSGETGMGVVPSTAQGRRFRDIQGEANQILATASASVVMAVCGLPLVLKS